MAQGWRVSTTRRHLEKRARTHVVRPRVEKTKPPALAPPRASQAAGILLACCNIVCNCARQQWLCLLLVKAQVVLGNLHLPRIRVDS